MWEKIVAFFMSVIAFFSSLFGFSTGHEYKLFKNVAYGAHERQVVDICLPTDSDKDEIGLVLFIHGGAWILADKEGYEDNIEGICEDYGYAAAALNYRYLSEDTDMYDILDDIESALATVKQTASENGLKVTKVLLTGSSAGAHLSMLYAYSRKDTAPIEPVAVVNYCGPTDLTDDNYYYNSDLGEDGALGDDEFIAQLFSYACGKDFTYETRDSAIEELKKVSPLYYVDENTVPTVINHGQKDNIVPFSNASALVKKFDECGVKYDLNIYPNSSHGLDKDKQCSKTADKLFEEYMKTYLG